jgi:ABC-type polysaccharide/polyol phosphate export permease
MFATPVAYPLSLVPASLLPLYLVNPMTPLIEGYRRILLHGQPPEPGPLAVALVAVTVVLVPAYLAFKHAERTFADVI